MNFKFLTALSISFILNGFCHIQSSLQDSERCSIDWRGWKSIKSPETGVAWVKRGKLIGCKTKVDEQSLTRSITAKLDKNGEVSIRFINSDFYYISGNRTSLTGILKGITYEIEVFDKAVELHLSGEPHSVVTYTLLLKTARLLNNRLGTKTK